jgi:coenzyme F420-0:L-glutamate ligase/coenzyme F420-1:gamma-L-glutamate ligase
VLTAPDHGIVNAAPPAIRDAVLGRRSIRYFLSEPVAESVIRDLLEDTVWAPSPHNSQPWRFTVLLSRVAKSSLADAMGQRLIDELCARGTRRVDAEQQAERSRRRIAGAPVVILCSLQPDGLAAYSDTRMNALEWEMAIQSVGAALQTLFLLAYERGLGACWMAAPMYCPDVVRSALHLTPDLHPQALVLMGYPAKPGKQRERRPLDKVIEVQ